MSNDKSYLEIKVTFQHIVVLLVGVIIIGIFLFFLGLQAGKSKDDGENTGPEGKNVQIIKKDDPDRIEDVKEKPVTTNEEIKLHQRPEKKNKPKVNEQKTVEPKLPQKEAVNTGKADPSEPYFAIQVAAFNSHELAKNYSKKFTNAGYQTAISQTVVKGKTWHRVRVGHFETRAQAKDEKLKLEKLENKRFRIVRSR